MLKLDENGLPGAARLSTPRIIAGDLLSGMISGIIVLSYCISFASLLFPASFAAERATGMWALLVGSIVVGVIVAWRTTMPPLTAAPDSPGIAVLSTLGVSVAQQVLASGGTPANAIVHVLLCFTLATATTGLTMFVLGKTGTANYIRFIPYPVAAGFIGATGLLMITSSLQVVLGRGMAALGTASLPPTDKLTMLGAAGGTALLCILVRTYLTRSLGVPLVCAATTLLCHLGLLSGYIPADQAQAWFNPVMQPPEPWSPLWALATVDIDWQLIAGQLPEICAVAGVMIVSMVIKTTNLELVRATACDLDREFKATGIANLLCALCGGIVGSLQSTPSRALTEAGAVTRASGLVSALTLAIALVSSQDLTALLPVPVLGGILVYFGWMSLVDTLGRPSAHLSWLDVALILVIIATCARAGYPAGGVLGFVLSCVIFVFRYRSIGVVRKHLTRANFASTLDRPAEEVAWLREHGDRIQIYWLSGYVFFGSSDLLYDRIRCDVEEASEPARVIVLDFSAVTGLDISATKSLAKLSSYCDRRAITMVYAGLSDRYERILTRGRFIAGQSRHHALPTRNDALEWAENKVLAEARAQIGLIKPVTFDEWLARGIAPHRLQDLLPYLDRYDLPAGAIVCRQGDNSDTIEFVSTGCVAIFFTDAEGRKIRLRRMSQNTVVGEMGFFRSAVRTANVETETPTVLYSISRANWVKLLAEEPHLAAALLQFILRVLSDRLEFANREVSALG